MCHSPAQCWGLAARRASLELVRPTRLQWRMVCQDSLGLHHWVINIVICWVETTKLQRQIQVKLNYACISIVTLLWLLKLSYVSDCLNSYKCSMKQQQRVFLTCCLREEQSAVMNNTLVNILNCNSYIFAIPVACCTTVTLYLHTQTTCLWKSKRQQHIS